LSYIASIVSRLGFCCLQKPGQIGKHLFNSLSDTRRCENIPGDLLHHISGTGRIEPEDLDGVRAPNLHFQSTAHRRELQVGLARPDRRDDTQSDLGDVWAVPCRLDNMDRSWDHRGVLAVELWASKKTFSGHGTI
jgi:hypothetical protein